MASLPQRTGGRLIVDALEAQAVRHVFCVPGESYLAVLDALHDSAIALTVCRQEGGAAMMAEAEGKLTGRPGIAMVTRGPGATNASHAIHIAAQDSTPMILFIGQVERGMREREAFQEVDYKAFFGSMAKWVVEIDSAARIPELVTRAFRVAMQGRPGPVVIALPEDTLLRQRRGRRCPLCRTGADLARQCRHDAPAVPALGRRAPLPDRRRVGLVGARGGRPGALRGALRPADRHLVPPPDAVSRRPSELCRRCRHRAEPQARRAGEGRRPADPGGRPDVGDAVIVLQPDRHPQSPPVPGACPCRRRGARPRLSAGARHQCQPRRLRRRAGGAAAAAHRSAGASETHEANAQFHAWTDNPPAHPGAFQYGEALAWLRDRLPDDAIICNGAGNYAIWVQRFLRFRRFGTQLAPTSGSMGYGLPAAVGAKRVFPERMVVCFAGDGCFLMNGQEFATAVQYDLPIIVVIVDNGMYGTIRMHQERTFPGRVSGTALVNPDFAAYARAFGGHGETVETTAEFAPAFERAVASGKPSILHCRIDPEAITPTTTLSALREKALGEGGAP